MRALKFAGVFVASIMLLAACSKEPDTIKIALLAPLSGPVPTFGVMTRDGALLAIEEWNAKGGVLNKKLQAVVEGQPVHTGSGGQRRQQGHRPEQGQVHHGGGLLQGLHSRLRNRQRQEGHPDQLHLHQSGRDRGQGRQGKGLHLPRLLHRSVPGDGGCQVCPRNVEGQERSSSCSTRPTTM